MEHIDIGNVQAYLTSLNIDYKADKTKLPDITLTLQLMTSTGTSLTSYTLRTQEWGDMQKIDIDPDVYEVLGSIYPLLERVIAKHCRSSLGQLEYTPTKEEVVG